MEEQRPQEIDLSLIEDWYNYTTQCVDVPVITTHELGSTRIKSFMENPYTNIHNMYFVSINFHTDRTITNRGKSKSFFACSQAQQYNYFKEILLKNKMPECIKFCYSFFEQNKEGKLHLHQIVYMPEKDNYWDYQAYLFDKFNFTKNEIKHGRSLYIRVVDDLDGCFMYTFNKTTKFYEIVNQTIFKPLIFY